MIAVYAGSFDPVTNGHLDIISRAARLFDSVHVLVAVNPDKKYMFTPETRAEAIRACVGEDIKVLVFNGFIADYTKSLSEKSVVVRGMRDASDAVYELALCKGYRDMGISETVILPATDGLESVSSTEARAALISGGSASCIPEKAMEVFKKEL